jgi:ubiquinone/menaquinone biosynthesis C-methylase UbiE
MPSAYDHYDYPSYWEGREYEHEAEIIAIKALLGKIPKIKTIAEIGAGYGRLTPSYMYRANKVILIDPSAKLLKIARNNLQSKKVSFIHSKLETLPKKTRKNSIDLIIMVRVLHHIGDLDKAFQVAGHLLKKNGHLLLEFANKKHAKATFLELLRGNFTFPLEIFPQDRRSPKNKKAKTLPFKNYHPDQILEKLKESGFSAIETRSVSNIRSTTMKRILSMNTLLFLEKNTQTLFSQFKLGPSIFILAKHTR